MDSVLKSGNEVLHALLAGASAPKLSPLYPAALELQLHPRVVFTASLQHHFVSSIPLLTMQLSRVDGWCLAGA
jgi:hypothetical protein